MQIGIPRETRPGEMRVAATPETVKKMAAAGKHSIVVEAGAGTGSSVPDADYDRRGCRDRQRIRRACRGSRAEGSRARRRRARPA